MHSQRIFLIGPMGSGKTTIGRRLAEALDLEFVDSDHALEERTGADIPLIFELEGEEGFRRRETAMLDELTQRDGVVLATGGGSVLREENRAYLRSRGVVIYLETPVDKQLQRTRHDRQRPLLQTADPRARLEELMQVREPLYRELADITISTNRGTLVTMVKQLVEMLRKLDATTPKQA